MLPLLPPPPSSVAGVAGAAGAVSRKGRRFPAGARALVMAGAVLLAALGAGCQAPSPATGQSAGGAASSAAADPAVAGAPAALPLSAGDMIRVTFAVETNLNTAAKIQLDGQVALPLVGDVPAAGLTVAALQADLKQRYQRFLKDDEVTVSLATSSASVYVTGAVLRPGRIAMDRPLTALEAIMEAGGFDPRANTGAVTVLRLENGLQRRHQVDLRSTLKGADPQPFWLKPFDIVNVPERRFNF